MAKGWIGVDLDGTLARYIGWRGHRHIGMPVMPMVERVKAWIAEGQPVKIFTARVYCGEADDPQESEESRAAIVAWCIEHIGVSLPVTCTKDYQMIELWDDRAVTVIPNTGIGLGVR